MKAFSDDVFMIFVQLQLLIHFQNERRQVRRPGPKTESVWFAYGREGIPPMSPNSYQKQQKNTNIKTFYKKCTNFRVFYFHTHLSLLHMGVASPLMQQCSKRVCLL